MTEHRTVHDRFTIERRYPAAPQRVFAAFATPEGKARWFGGSDGSWEEVDRAWDFRPGGHEVLAGRWQNGVTHRFDATYYEIIPDTRIVYAYEMHLDDARISVSLATIEIFADGTGARLKITEQGAFFDGYDDNGSRERGTLELIDRLGRSLED